MSNDQQLCIEAVCLRIASGVALLLHVEDNAIVHTINWWLTTKTRIVTSLYWQKHVPVFRVLNTRRVA